MVTSPSQKPLVLLVEDNETYRKAVKVALEANGFETLEAENGKIALDMLKSDRLPYMIVSDVYMPEMDGIQFLEAIKNDPKLSKLPIVMLTNVQEEIEHSVKLGANEAVFKASITPKQLVDICLRYVSEPATT